MRSRGFVLYVCGVVTGAVGLYLILWSGGVLTPYLDSVRAYASHRSGESDRAAAIAPASVPAASLHTPAPPPPGPASKEGGVVLPIDGLKRADVLDTFNQGRSEGKSHEATDIMAPRGTPVHAMVDGVIEKLFDSKPGGLTIYEFDKSREYAYYYAHLDRYAEGIREGMEVARGTVIAYVGSTGNAHPDAPHLHLAIFLLGPEKRWWQGAAVNPHPILMEALR